MKSRMMITTMLVVGVLMSMSGAGLALSGPSGSSSASDTQYDTPTTQRATPTVEAAKTVQPAKQVAVVEQTTESDDLPFTGYSALPVVLGGLVLLTGGLILRRRTRRQPQA